MNEQEMRDADVPTIKTMDELKTYIDTLVEQPHDYGTCVYALSMSAQAAFNYVAGRLGVTGFQAGCAEMDFLKRSRGMKHGFRILDYSHLLYPQYCDDEHFPSWQTLITQNIKPLKDAARKLLEESPNAHPDVLAHWGKIIMMPEPEEEPES